MATPAFVASLLGSLGVKSMSAFKVAVSPSLTTLLTLGTSLEAGRLGRGANTPRPHATVTFPSARSVGRFSMADGPGLTVPTPSNPPRCDRTLLVEGYGPLAAGQLLLRDPGFEEYEEGGDPELQRSKRFLQALRQTHRD